MRARAILTTLAAAAILATPALIHGNQLFAPALEGTGGADGNGNAISPHTAGQTLSVRDGRQQGFEIAPTAASAEGRLQVHTPIVRLGDGAGADVADLELWQIDYSDEVDGNVVRVIWTENTFNPPGTVRVFLDDELLGTLDGIPQDDLPARRAVDVPNVEAGTRIFSVEANSDGSFVEGQIEVLEEQPFRDPFNVRCGAGAVDEEQGVCELVVRYESVAPFATRFLVFYRSDTIVDPVVLTPSLDPIPSPFGVVRLVDASPGENCLGLVPFLETENGIYRGGTVEVCCDLTCEPEPCGEPVSLQFCQLEYGTGGTLEVSWVNGQREPDEYVAVNAFVNGEVIGSVPGAPVSGQIAPIAPGDVDIGIQGDCGGGLTSDILTGTFMMLAESPHPAPISGTLQCEFDGVELATSWTNNPEAPSSLIEVWIAPEGDVDNALFQGFLFGDQESFATADVLQDGARLRGIVEDDVLVLRFRTVVDLDGDGVRDRCHSSPLIACGEGDDQRSFIRGICNGVVTDPDNPTPQITSAVFLFNFLFLGGPVPPCMEACDVDGEPPVNLTDGVFLLNFLFLSGPAPSGWLDPDMDGFGDPTCERAPAEDCATSAEYCP